MAQLYGHRGRDARRALLVNAFFTTAQIQAFNFVASRKKVELISSKASESSEGMLRANQCLDTDFRVD